MSEPFGLMVGSNMFCVFTETSMNIADSTDSGKQMSCDKVVTNVL